MKKWFSCTIQCFHLCWMILVYPLILPLSTQVCFGLGVGHACDDHTPIDFLN
jgi:hypothetical protein